MVRAFRYTIKTTEGIYGIAANTVVDEFDKSLHEDFAESYRIILEGQYNNGSQVGTLAVSFVAL